PVPHPEGRHGDWVVGLGGLAFAATYVWRRRRIVR
ncbi:MAG: hypothetical protein RL067_51, partial [Verrucomicrobiota bacterium]